jgi:hypothetical protein
MIRKSGDRFSEKIMLNRKLKSAMVMQPDLIALQAIGARSAKIKGTRRRLG